MNSMASITASFNDTTRPDAMLVLPNLVIAGAPKCGTSSVFYWLQNHPEVLASSKKEAQFLMDRDSSTFRPALNYHDHGLAAYARHFDADNKKAGQKIVLEATPGYLYQETALRVFAQDMPQTRLIFILREPARRLLSVYHYFSQNRRDLDRGFSFEAFVEAACNNDARLRDNEYLRGAIHHGQYLEYLQRWSDQCGKERLLIYLFEDLERDPRGFMQRLCTDTGIEPAYFGPDFRFVKENYSYKVRWQILHNGVVRWRHLIPKGAFRKKLKALYHRFNTDKGQKTKPQQTEMQVLERMKAYYRPYNEALAAFFNLDLSAWK